VMKKLSLLLSFTLLAAVAWSAETGAFCTIEDDCPVLHNCLSSDTNPNVKTCVHKPLFPITAREVIGTIINVFLNALLTAGGVGAGAAYVPYIILLFRTTLSHAIYIAYLCVFGGGMGNLVNIIGQRNPKTKRFLTNYSLNMIILPALMIGVMFGMILQRIFPPLVTHLILLCTLAYALYKNYGKLKINLAKERKERQAKKEAVKVEELACINTATEPDRVVTEQAPEQAKKVPEPVKESVKEPAKEVDRKMSGQEKGEDMTVMTCLPDKGSSRALNVIIKPSDVNLAQLQGPVVEAEIAEKDALAEKRKCIYEREEKFPFHKIREILPNVIIIVVIGLIRGSKTFKPIVGVEWTCGWDFLWFGIAILAYGTVLTRCLYLVLKWQKEKKEVGYEFLPEEPFMDRPKIIKLIIVSTIAGTIGAIVALGGSMIVGPTLLDFKMPPTFSSATTGFFMIFAMFNTTFTTILNGKVTAAEIAWFLPLSFLFSFISGRLVTYYVKKTGKQSVIIKCVMLVAALGFVCLLAIMIKDLVEDTQAQIDFKGVC